jgi:hypothetical protein
LIANVDAVSRCNGQVANHVEDSVAAKLSSPTLKLAGSGRQPVRECVGHRRADRNRIGVINTNLNIVLRKTQSHCQLTLVLPFRFCAGYCDKPSQDYYAKPQNARAASLHWRGA